MSTPTLNTSASNGYIGENFITLAFNVPLDDANPPLISAFTTFEVNGTPVTITGVVVDSASQTVKLSLSGFLLAGDIVSVDYTDPSFGNDASAIQGVDGADAASFSTSMTVAIGRPGPSAPPTPSLDSASDSGTLGDGITKVNTPTLSGTADANDTVKLYDTDGTTLLGTTTADGAGKWSITSSTLADGSHTLKVTQTDGSSATSPLSTGTTITIDTVSAAPTTLAMAAGSDSGTLGDGITNVGTPAITGKGEANSTVKLYDTDGTTLLGTTTADGTGKWSITTTTLAEGSHTLTAKQTDVAGNISKASSGFAYVLDTIGPIGMALSQISANKSVATNGSTMATLSSTDDTTVTYGFKVGNGTVDADNGKFTISGTSLVAAQTLTAGDYHIYLKATDAAGNDAYKAFTYTVSDAPGVTSIVRAASASSTVQASATSVDYTVTFDQSVTGVDLTDFTMATTGSATGTPSGISGSGSTYTVTVNTLGGDGTLGLSLKSSGTGIQNGSSTAISGGYTAGETFTMDHTAPTAPSTPSMTAGTDTGASSSDAITSNVTPVFTGTGEANSTVKLYDTDGTTLRGTATADGSGKWSITSSTLAEGAHTLTVKQTDAAGNVSTASSGKAVTIDTTAPSAPTTPTLSTGSDSGTSGDFLTNITTPVITGTSEASAKIKLYDTDGTTLLGTTTADGSGKWSITSSTLANGSHTMTVKQTDPAGNVSKASSGLTLQIDTSTPSTPGAPVLSPGSDTGTLGDNITSTATPVFTGIGTVGSTVTLYDTGGTTMLGTATVDGAGHWSVTSSTLSVGAHTLTTKQSNVAGTFSSASTSLGLTISAPPPPPPAAPTVIDGVTVSQQTVNLPGGGSGTQTTIPIVTSSRVDDTGSSGLADIPLVTGGGSTLLAAHVPQGFGLTAQGGSSQPAGDPLQQLIQAIKASTPNNAPSDQAHLTGNGSSFLNLLPGSIPVLVETVVPTASGATSAPLNLTGVSSFQQHTALVIDATQLPSGNAGLTLTKVDFAAVVGSASVTGTTNGQILTGDAANQQFTVTAGTGSSVFSGGGNDTLVLAPGAQADSSASGAASAASAASAIAPQATALLLGNTLFHGGLGTDTASFSGLSTDYTIDAHYGYLTIASKAQPTLQTLVINVENLKFSDTTVAVQVDPLVSTVAGLYQSVLGRQADYLGVDWWVTLAKQGRSLGDIALNLITSAESQSRNKMAFSGDNAHDVEILYQTLYNRHSDAPGLAYWVDQMAHGATLQSVAQSFVQSPEMTAHLIAVPNMDFLVG